MAASLQQAVINNVRQALAEDIGSGDITAQLIPQEQHGTARVITRDKAVICGQPWVNEVFRQVNPEIVVDWQVPEGGQADAGTTLFTVSGPAQGLLTGERAALNFLQLLSGTATCCQVYAYQVAGTGVKLLDTRKTIPGLRLAQKYAVRTGSCHNHRIGLYDAFLIKENHITACGSIEAAVTSARQLAPGKPVEVEVESLEELQRALECGSDIVMLDNFSLDDLKQAVHINQTDFNGKAQLEASGGITFNTLRPIAETGVDYISIGALTKSCRAIDLSMRFTSM
ncbi:carboxylating nicotinate-nucleotide diphosphorylase [Sansalvadorimonas sp. 2012CJ34-2]|uniref:nicotinate-nucleotide diphosphorylase (carboxylating) n=1 Tax=Parendozoicomonas callyspongiae TaxID=2942213 RepID=A0ABT0PF67_9GAMM|nr:carboxylating nicotinate-nucleotide diphosphorylase [Sansalvadorimonas sp. 2012CJ34-2]MCL6269963.1 carboxylating nicotinate-nucleotide diphosphorylase [Sansalvadorimonas sp. 2012CJ34-2]